jgi:transcriptional regulator with XRE-family HTH domain
MVLGEKVRIIREMRGLKQGELAAKLGLTAGAYSNMERGISDMTVTRLQEIAKILQVSASDILDFEPEKIFPIKRGQ